MVELRKFAHDLENVIGIKAPSGKNSADEINEEHWLDVVTSKLNSMSIECARELEKETGKYPKPNYPDGQPLEKAPPTRLLALNLVISYWLGWVNNEKNADGPPLKAWTRIQEGYMAGRLLSESHEVP